MHVVLWCLQFVYGQLFCFCRWKSKDWSKQLMRQHMVDVSYESRHLCVCFPLSSDIAIIYSSPSLPKCFGNNNCKCCENVKYFVVIDLYDWCRMCQTILPGCACLLCFVFIQHYAKPIWAFCFSFIIKHICLSCALSWTKIISRRFSFTKHLKMGTRTCHRKLHGDLLHVCCTVFWGSNGDVMGVVLNRDLLRAAITVKALHCLQKV